ncbi:MULTISPECIES: NADH-quinone oxidoreductase subunit NuoK [Thermodesulfovibrio]|jgi:NADH-quinone oxidoreductase subunit K|uniref:NADH-quinone oxidoreductase subunit K n=1 Tax=Thermodesulfovibrio yellowstonii (strain ATCC 51303 / DSM 11347 / YP87) TaxID=289376 RepID=B5YL28_THEYD|nr:MULTISPECIES: NADH-quinone oxidoreductase subunit NuoK [Thermodesulfovibrio]ACI20533.1 NAD(P)H-quinone oxidoreductase chain 4L (NAD(P)Hdehydrogenase I, chain 4L) [Thermodesulfovibrio yellowstonii DSM 11347]MDI6864118.1 NADH-quinone oxidoreductase subunit NuoK [Thermodesulfovibrio yellowstonii]
MIPLEAYLILAGLIFSMGLINLLINRNLIIVFVSLEVMLAGVNLALVALSHYMNDIRGQVLAIFTIAVAAGSVAVGLSLLIAHFNLKKSVDTEEIRELKEE